MSLMTLVNLMEEKEEEKRRKELIIATKLCTKKERCEKQGHFGECINKNDLFKSSA